MADNCRLYDLTGLKSLEGVTLEPNVVLSGLTGLKSLAGVTLAPNVILTGLTGLKSLEGVTLAPNVELHGLNGLESLGVPPVTEAEWDILKTIPLDQVDMKSWHCGTSHCLAGWAQVRCGKPTNEPLACGLKYLPSLSHLFFAPTPLIRQMLLDMHTAHGTQPPNAA